MEMTWREEIAEVRRKVRLLSGRSHPTHKAEGLVLRAVGPAIGTAISEETWLEFEEEDKPLQMRLHKIADEMLDWESCFLRGRHGSKAAATRRLLAALDEWLDPNTVYEPEPESELPLEMLAYMRVHPYRGRKG